MKSLQKKPADVNDLDLHWAKASLVTREKRVDYSVGVAPKRVEEYLDFLEEIGPLQPDTAKPKIYSERFTL
jgi:hypothetical protein